MTDNSSRRVLIIDDAALVRTYYRSALEPHGFAVEEALNGLEGLEKLLMQPFDLAIVDVNMPQMDGITFVRNVAIEGASGLRHSGSDDKYGGRTSGYGRSAERWRELLSGETGQAGNAGGICGDLLRSAAMNEFVEQFLLESRELVAQAIDDLMALEEHPDDRERLDGAFRAFHTLKGAAGIVDFPAMARMLHAAEDILASLRSSEQPVAPSVLDECLASLDLTSRWLDAMQTSGEAPSDSGRRSGCHDCATCRFARWRREQSGSAPGKRCLAGAAARSRRRSFFRSSHRAALCAASRRVLSGSRSAESRGRPAPPGGGRLRAGRPGRYSRQHEHLQLRTGNPRADECIGCRGPHRDSRCFAGRQN